jgi:hypothetical protein
MRCEVPTQADYSGAVPTTATQTRPDGVKPAPFAFSSRPIRVSVRNSANPAKAKAYPIASIKAQSQEINGTHPAAAASRLQLLQ